MPQRSLNLIDRYISNYFYTINSLGQLHMIEQANKLPVVICGIESDRLEGKGVQEGYIGRGRISW